MALARIHLLSRAEPWYAGDNLEVACGLIVLHPVAKGMIDDDGSGFLGLGFLGVCPKCNKAVQAKPQRYLYAIVEAQEALTPEALEATA